MQPHRSSLPVKPAVYDVSHMTACGACACVCVCEHNMHCEARAQAACRQRCHHVLQATLLWLQATRQAASSGNRQCVQLSRFPTKGLGLHANVSHQGTDCLSALTCAADWQQSGFAARRCCTAASNRCHATLLTSLSHIATHRRHNEQASVHCSVIQTLPFFVAPMPEKCRTVKTAADLLPCQHPCAQPSPHGAGPVLAQIVLTAS